MHPAKTTWDQVVAMKHWHDCELATHTIAQCSADMRHQHTLIWAGDALSLAGLATVAIVACAAIRRGFAHRFSPFDRRA